MILEHDFRTGREIKDSPVPHFTDEKHSGPEKVSDSCEVHGCTARVLGFKMLCSFSYVVKSGSSFLERK